MLSDNELKEILAKIIKANNEEGEEAAIKVLADVIQEEKGKMADLGFKAIITALDAVAENQQK